MDKKTRNKIFGTLIKVGVLLYLVYASCTGAYINGGLYSDSEIQFYGLLSFLIVTFCCMIVPFIWRVINRQPFTCEKGKKICKWNSIIVGIISIILYVIIEINLVGWIYAIIYYFINKWSFVDENTPDLKAKSKKKEEKVTNIANTNQIQEDENITENIVKDTLKVKRKTKYCKYCGGKLNNDKKCIKCGKQYFKFNKNILISLIIWVLVISNVVFILLYNDAKNEAKNISEACNDDSLCETELNTITGGYDLRYAKGKIDFYDENIVFVIEGAGNKYYTYDNAQNCLPGAGIVDYEDYIHGKDHPLKNGKYSYKVYNKSEAIRLGYTDGTC